MRDEFYETARVWLGSNTNVDSISTVKSLAAKLREVSEASAQTAAIEMRAVCTRYVASLYRTELTTGAISNNISKLPLPQDALDLALKKALLYEYKAQAERSYPVTAALYIRISGCEKENR